VWEGGKGMATKSTINGTGGARGTNAAALVDVRFLFLDSHQLWLKSIPTFA
jgi:hypothetical protein